jgi:hypothetical protein
MNLEELLRLDRTIRVIGFDDAPFLKRSGKPVGLAGVICAGTRFEGMLWGYIEADGLDATETIDRLLTRSKFLSQLHILLLDGIAVGGFNVIDLPQLSARLQLPCVAVMRRKPNLEKIGQAIEHLPQAAQRWETIARAGEIYEYPPFYFQVCGAEPKIVASVLAKLTDRGNVPEALRLAHLIGAAFVKGESGRQA